MNLYPPDHRRQAALTLSLHLKAVIGQVLMARIGGGRVAAREVVFNTPALASVLANGRASQLHTAIEAGRSNGMVLLNDALIELVRSGAVEAAEAYRHAPEPTSFLEDLARAGVPASVIHRQ